LQLLRKIARIGSGPWSWIASLLQEWLSGQISNRNAKRTEQRAIATLDPPVTP
jgi:hypothetical protein